MYKRCSVQTRTPWISALASIFVSISGSEWNSRSKKLRKQLFSWRIKENSGILLWECLLHKKNKNVEGLWLLSSNNILKCYHVAGMLPYGYCKSNHCWLFAMSLEHEMLLCTIFTLGSLPLKVFHPPTATELEVEHKISKRSFSYCTGVEVSHSFCLWIPFFFSLMLSSTLLLKLRFQILVTFMVDDDVLFHCFNFCCCFSLVVGHHQMYQCLGRKLKPNCLLLMW